MAPAVTLRDAAPTSRAMVVAVMVSMVAFLDSTVINLALPAIEHDLGGGLALQQWIVDGYLLAMAAAILPGGSISDLFGRVPVMRFGLLAFGAGSVLAAAATSPAMLITARLIQGLGAAFLVPGSLALINTVFDKAHQSAAIGVWTGWTGTAFALGPLLGGICVDYLGWRWIFVLSAVPMAVGFALTFWLCPMSGRVAGARVDTAGIGLSAVGLAATVYALIESQRHGWTNPMVIAPSVIGIAALAGFVSWQHRSSVSDASVAAVRLSQLRCRQPGHRVRLRRADAGIAGHRPLHPGNRWLLCHRGRTGHPADPGAVVRVRPSCRPHRRAGGTTRVPDRRPRLGGDRAAADPPETQGIPRDHRPGPRDDRAGDRAGRDDHTAVSVTLASVPTEHSGLASAINNAVSRLAALISIGSIGLISVGTASATGFAHVLEVSAALFALGALCAALLITNPPAGYGNLCPATSRRCAATGPVCNPPWPASPSTASETSPPQ